MAAMQPSGNFSKVAIILVLTWGIEVDFFFN
jgi:hypothetical protein